MKPSAPILPVEEISPLIKTIRNQRVILDSDLALIYGVETKTLNRAVKRNTNRFPAEFVFVLEPQSLFGNYEERCGEGFWLWPRRRVPSIPAAGCTERANAGHGQKSRRPEGFRGKDRLASLLLSRRSTRDILLRRASPCGLFPENSAPRSFQTGSMKSLL
jgi:hypothetical protein